MSDTHQIADGQMQGWILRIRPSGRPEAHSGLSSGAWTIAPLRLLARHYDRHSPVWTWLRGHGIRRPSPSGSRVTVPHTERSTVRVELSLEPDVAARLRAAADAAGVSVSAWVASRV